MEKLLILFYVVRWKMDSITMEICNLFFFVLQWPKKKFIRSHTIYTLGRLHDARIEWQKSHSIQNSLRWMTSGDFTNWQPLFPIWSGFYQLRLALRRSFHFPLYLHPCLLLSTFYKKCFVMRRRRFKVFHFPCCIFFFRYLQIRNTNGLTMTHQIN